MAIKMPIIREITRFDDELESEPMRFEMFRFSVMEPVCPMKSPDTSALVILAEFQAAKEIRLGRQRFSLHVAVQISAS